MSVPDEQTITKRIRNWKICLSICVLVLLLAVLLALFTVVPSKSERENAFGIWVSVVQERPLLMVGAHVVLAGFALLGALSVLALLFNHGRLRALRRPILRRREEQA